MTHRRDEGTGGTLAIRYWHIVLFLILQLFGAGVFYQTVQDTRERLTKAEAQALVDRANTRQDIQTMTNEINRRLDGITDQLIKLAGNGR